MSHVAAAPLARAAVLAPAAAAPLARAARPILPPRPPTAGQMADDAAVAINAARLAGARAAGVAAAAAAATATRRPIDDTFTERDNDILDDGLVEDATDFVANSDGEVVPAADRRFARAPRAADVESDGDGDSGAAAAPAPPARTAAAEGGARTAAREGGGAGGPPRSPPRPPAAAAAAGGAAGASGATAAAHLQVGSMRL